MELITAYFCRKDSDFCRIMSESSIQKGCCGNEKSPIAVLVFSISLNLLLIAAIANQKLGIPVAEAIKNISEPGTYGPPAMEIVDGDATITATDVTLQNLLITGNLLLTDQVNAGTVDLSSVQVQGEIIIAGKGFTLRLHDCPVKKITVQEQSPGVKLIASGTAKVDQVVVAAEASCRRMVWLKVLWVFAISKS